MKKALLVDSVNSRGVGGVNPNFILRDYYETALAAGAVNGTPAEPGPGNRTVVDTGNLLSIDSKLTASNVTGLNDPSIQYGPFARKAGRAALAYGIVMTGATIMQYGFFTANPITVASGEPCLRGVAAGATYKRLGSQAQAAAPNLGGSPTSALATGVILRTSGGFCVQRSSTQNRWRLTWVEYSGATASLYPGIEADTAPGFSVAKFKVADLGAPFDTDWGLVTTRLDGARAGGDSFTHEPDFVFDIVITTLAAGMQIAFRMQDANNYWRVDINADGSLALQEVIAGTPTSRGTAAAGTVVNGHRLVVAADGGGYSVYTNDVRRFTHNSATGNFVTATGGKILALGTGGALTDLRAWPRNLSGPAYAQLESLFAF